jgi:hypothetical protein
MTFSFGRILEDNARLTLMHYLPAVSVSLLFSAISLIVFMGFGAPIFNWVFDGQGRPGFIYGILLNWKLWLVFVAYLLSSAATSAYMMHFAGLIGVATARGLPVRTSAVLAEALSDLPKVYPRVLKFNLLVMVMTTPGTLLFLISVGFIPFVYFIFPTFGALFGPILAATGYFAVVCLYYPFFGVMAAERRYDQDVLDRAAELTENNRWKIFGLLMAVFLAIGVLVFLVALIVTLAGSPLVSRYASSLIQALCMPYLMFLPTSLYLALNKERLTGSDVANVFA